MAEHDHDTNEPSRDVFAEFFDRRARQEAIEQFDEEAHNKWTRALLQHHQGDPRAAAYINLLYGPEIGTRTMDPAERAAIIRALDDMPPEQKEALPRDVGEAAVAGTFIENGWVRDSRWSMGWRPPSADPDDPPL